MISLIILSAISKQLSSWLAQLMKAALWFNFVCFPHGESMTWQNCCFCPSHVCIADMSDGAFCSFLSGLVSEILFPDSLLAGTEQAVVPLLSLSPSRDQFLLFPMQFLLKGTSPVWQLENAPLFCFASLWGIPSFREHKYLAVSGIKHSPWFLWEITEQLKIYFYVISVKRNILMGCTKKIYILKPSHKSNIILNVIVWSLI